MQPVIVVTKDDFDSAALISALHANRTDIGAVVSFTGLCRDENNTLQALELEHYPGMAQAQLAQIAAQAVQRWPLQALTIVHRYGLIAAGGQIVFVATASQHRKAAFEAAEFLMDFLKTDAPFWKKEHLTAPDPAQDSRERWVAAKASDHAHHQRWTQR